jgi:hypothetical protein
LGFLLEDKVPNWLIVVFLAMCPASFAQNAGQRGQAPPAGPAPRLANGRVNLGAPLGEKGLWQGDGRLVINPKSYEPRTTLNAWIDIKDVPLQDWARALVDARHTDVLRFEPHARCKASGGPREFVTPYGFEIVEMPELQRVFMMDIGGPHSFRIIYMDGRQHPKDLLPSYYGHSVGHWEGDTLVIDAVGFNEKFWMSRDGLPHTDRLHLIERFSRPDSRTLKYEVTVDDPGAYTAPWTSGFNLRWSDGLELFEYVCQDNNHFPESVFDDTGHIGSTPPIAP